MPIKSYFLLFLLSGCVFLSGAETASGTKTQQNVQPAQKRSTLRSPDKPTLQKYRVDSILRAIREKLVSRKFPDNCRKAQEEIRKHKKGTPFPVLTKADMAGLLVPLRQYVMNPDLEEVTGIRKNWFISIGKLVAAFQTPADAMMHSVQFGNQAEYARALWQSSYLSRQLDALLKAPVKIPAKEMDVIRQKNYQRRYQEIYGTPTDSAQKQRSRKR